MNFKTLRNLLIRKMIPDRKRRVLKWKLTGKKISRNSWFDKDNPSWKIYLDEMNWSWREIEEKAPLFFRRLEVSVKYCEGTVLEIGAGIGTMTRWISKNDNVSEIIAIDAFSEAIDEMKKYKISKTTPLRMNLEDIMFPEGTKFDTIVICEVIEHLYPDEERLMLEKIKQYIDENTIYIISTPIGWLPDKYHIRGFSKKEFEKHLKKYYGNSSVIHRINGYSQIAYGKFRIKGGKKNEYESK